MKAGRLRFQFLVQNPKPADIGSGNYIAGWTDANVVWGDMEGLSGRDKFYAAQAGSQATHRITVRWMDCINGRSRLILSPGPPGSGEKFDRVINGSRVLMVEGCIDPDNRRRELRIDCVERT